MKLIIDLPKEKYEWIKTHNLNIDNDSIVGAVANGIPYNPTSNLISREALKKAFKIEELYWGKRIIDEINNASTVADRYNEGFRDGYAQCINDKEERKENNRLFQKGDKEE